jgi:hypothetical protein
MSLPISPVNPLPRRARGKRMCAAPAMSVAATKTFESPALGCRRSGMWPVPQPVFKTGEVV